MVCIHMYVRVESCQKNKFINELLNSSYAREVYTLHLTVAFNLTYDFLVICECCTEKEYFGFREELLQKFKIGYILEFKEDEVIFKKDGVEKLT